MLLSSVLFGLAHLYQGRGGLLGTVMLGTLFGVARIAYHSVVPVMVWHVAVDVVAGIAGPRYLTRIRLPAARSRVLNIITNWLLLCLSPCPCHPPLRRHRDVLGEFLIAVDDEQVSQIQQYMSMLLAWNEKVNLTAIRDPLEILYRHFCESMYAVGGGAAGKVVGSPTWAPEGVFRAYH